MNRMLRTDETTGFGTLSKDFSGRFYDKNGRPNVQVKGVGFLEGLSWYHTMINMSGKRFMALIFLCYIGINLVFTLIYAAIGIDHLSGIQKGTLLDDFMELFFFSTQTFTTVGYGRVSPMGMMTNGVATFEAFLGLLSFALATGLFYGRFSRPKAHLKYSSNALVSPFQGGKALMFRVVPYKKNPLSDVEVKLTLAIKEEENGVWKNKFYTLDTQISKINMLSLSWTIVHPINDKSPLYQLTDGEILALPMELLVFIHGFDEAYSNAVISRTSYLNTEVIANAKFKMMYGPSSDGNGNILDLDLLDAWEKVR